MITLSLAQGARSIDLLHDAITCLDQKIYDWVQTDLDDRPETHADDLAEMVEEHEQATRLREMIIAQLGRKHSHIWECPDEGCAWLNTDEWSVCEQCGQDQEA